VPIKSRIIDGRYSRTFDGDDRASRGIRRILEINDAVDARVAPFFPPSQVAHQPASAPKLKLMGARIEKLFALARSRGFPLLRSQRPAEVPPAI